MTGPQGRPMGRKVASVWSQLHPLERWFARRNPAGIWIIVDQHGEHPLKHIDAAQRIRNLHLAAAAPELRHELERILHRFRTVCREDGTESWKWNTRYIHSALNALMDSRPIYTETCTQSGGAAQAEIDWEEAA